MNGLIHDERPVFPTVAPQPYVLMNGNDQSAPAQNFNVLSILRRYWLLLLCLMIVGSAAGFASIVLSSPMYKTLLFMEVQNSSNGLPLNGASPQSGSEASEVDIQTQVNLLHSDGFLRRGAERMQSEAVAFPPMGRDIFSRLRQRIHPVTQDPLETQRTGLMAAVRTFEARPVTRTRLIELTCESTSPDVAAGFLNAMANEFVEDNNHSRIQTAQKTSEWLAAQIEETKSRVQEAEEKLREFVAASGNVFAGQDNATLDDTKLAQLKGELAKIQSERIARQTRYELTVKNPPESLGEVLDDAVMRGYQQQLQTLKRDRAVLDLTYTARDKKVQKIDAEIATVQKAYDNEVASTVKRIKNDYEASRSQEKLLSGAYEAQSSRVGSEASKTAQYNSLKREVDTQHQMYQTLLVQQSQANLNSSVPVNPIRIVEQANPPEEPYKPKPILNISFGTMFGLVLAGGIVFLRERMDRSIKAPGASRRMFNAPELGVIPNLGSNGNILPGGNGRTQDLLVNGDHDDGTALATWQSGPAFITESFRGTLASILRNQVTNKNQKMILITSPGPAEGKTTVVQNLGIALAESGRKVLLVDADFRRPHLHRKFSLPNEWGLIDVLCDDLPLNQYSPEQLGVFTGFPGLSILTNRVTQHNVSKALYSPRLRTILETLVNRYDMVIVDAPPILSVADTRIVASLTDALILVLRSGVTQREAAMEAYQLIQEDGLSLLGTVLTDYDLSSDRRRQYYYDYGDPSRA
jgi:succinoglycan biosynthesis transport protein ExoP